MSGPVIIPNTAQFEMIFTWKGQSVENVFHVHSDPGLGHPWDISHLTTFSAAFVSWWTSQMQSSVPSDVTLVRVHASDMGSADGNVIDYVTGLPLSGTASGTSMPNNVTFAVKWGSGKKGRSNRGRTFHIGTSEDIVTGNQLSPGQIAPFTTRYDALRSAIGSVVSGGTDNFVIASRRHLTTQNITTTSINPVLDSQRRRLPEHNRHR